MEEVAAKLFEGKSILAEHGFSPFVRSVIQWKLYQEQLQKVSQIGGGFLSDSCDAEMSSRVSSQRETLKSSTTDWISKSLVHPALP